MAQCTAPRDGHRTSSGAAACPVHGGRSQGYSKSYYTPATPKHLSSRDGGGSSRESSTGPTGGKASTAAERRTLAPIRREAEKQAAKHPERRDLFLCHAWPDRGGAAKEMHDALEANGVTVWFSEKDVPLGTSLLGQIDKGLRMSRIGIVLVTSALLDSIIAEGVAQKELSALLFTDRVIPVAHGITFEALRDVSPLLGARSGLDTAESSLEDVAAKVADAVLLKEPA